MGALETVRTSFLTLQAKQTPLRPLGGGEGEGEVGARTSPHDTTDPHPALRAGLSLQGRGVFFCCGTVVYKPLLLLTKPRGLLTLPSPAPARGGRGVCLP